MADKELEGLKDYKVITPTKRQGVRAMRPVRRKYRDEQLEAFEYDQQRNQKDIESQMKRKSTDRFGDPISKEEYPAEYYFAKQLQSAEYPEDYLQYLAITGRAAPGARGMQTRDKNAYEAYKKLMETPKLSIKQQRDLKFEIAKNTMKLEREAPYFHENDIGAQNKYIRTGPYAPGDAVVTPDDASEEEVLQMVVDNNTKMPIETPLLDRARQWIDLHPKEAEMLKRAAIGTAATVGTLAYLGKDLDELEGDDWVEQYNKQVGAATLGPILTALYASQQPKAKEKLKHRSYDIDRADWQRDYKESGQEEFDNRVRPESQIDELASLDFVDWYENIADDKTKAGIQKAISDAKLQDQKFDNQVDNLIRQVEYIRNAAPPKEWEDKYGPNGEYLYSEESIGSKLAMLAYKQQLKEQIKTSYKERGYAADLQDFLIANQVKVPEDLQYYVEMSNYSNLLAPNPSYKGEQYTPYSEYRDSGSSTKELKESRRALREGRKQKRQETFDELFMNRTKPEEGK